MLVRFLLLVLTMIFACAPVARASELVLVLSDRGGAYGEFADSLKKALAESSWHISAVVTPDRLGSEPALRSADLWVTVGGEATRQSLATAPPSGVLATLVTRGAFESMLGERPRSRIQGLVLDQPPERLGQLIQVLFPGRRKIGVLTGPDGRVRTAGVQQALRHTGLTQEIEEAADDAMVVPAANRLLARVDVLLALPDSLVFSRNNVPPVLLASFRYQRPVVGFSSAFVNAGAMVGLFSTPSQVARQVAEMLTTGRRPTATVLYPNRFSLSYNRQVAQSLGVELPEERSVLRALDNRGDD